MLTACNNAVWCQNVDSGTAEQGPATITNYTQSPPPLMTVIVVLHLTIDWHHSEWLGTVYDYDYNRTDPTHTDNHYDYDRIVVVRWYVLCPHWYTYT